MKLTVVQSVSNNGSWKLVLSNNHSIRCHPRSSSFPSNNLHVVSSQISTPGRSSQVFAVGLSWERREEKHIEEVGQGREGGMM